MLFLGGRLEALLEPGAPEFEPFDKEVSGVVEVTSWADGEGVSSMMERSSFSNSSTSKDSLNKEDSVFMVASSIPGLCSVCISLCFKASGMPHGPTWTRFSRCRGTES